eukprot:CAMPEP_0180153216 /NCGR_PEP_ID=MMETSP0986-20121125/23359_1 /TAXON_ID=697907 /ORGANISM="non described non described, Strain CCMP2293" /LENGTH=66 /DNA_ID=CAMNT_0022101193 /DNA_START=187 /DNA_END=387 /DNA_ORIENTATION=+
MTSLVPVPGRALLQLRRARLHHDLPILIRRILFIRGHVQVLQLRSELVHIVFVGLWPLADERSMRN